MPISPRQQEQCLRQILRQNVQTSLYKHLGLTGLQKVRDFELLYQGFSRSVPVSMPEAWLRNLRAMGSATAGELLDVIQRPNLLSATTPHALVAEDAVAYPQNANQVAGYADFLRQVQTHAGVLGGVFHLTDTATLIHGYWLPSAATAAQRRLTPWQRWRTSQPLIPDTPSARSRHQHLLDVYEYLLQHGQHVKTLIAHPRMLSQLALVIAQQQGITPNLAVLCPNLQVFVALKPSLGIYRAELKTLLYSLPLVQWRRALCVGNGLMASQEDPNIPQRFQPVDSGIFFEFIPAEDIRPDGSLKRAFRRFHLGQVIVGQPYLMLATHGVGILAERTEWLVKISSVDPFAFVWQRRADTLDTFEEALPEEMLSRQLDDINQAISGYGLYIREFVISADVESGGHHWVLELSRPLPEVDKVVLESIAKRLHTELELEHAPYRDAFRLGRMHAPVVTFVPMGTFAALPDVLNFNHLDTTPDGMIATTVLQQAGSQQLSISAAILL